MLERTEILRIIDEAYAARMRSDKAALARYWAPDATYRMSCDPGSLPVDVPVGPCDADQSTSKLVDMFQFHEMERLDVVIEGNRAALHWRIAVSTPDKPQISTEIAEFWEFTDDGKAKSLTQFVDTATLVSMVS